MSSDDSFTEVTEQSWFSRLADSIKSVLVGMVLFVVAFPVLFLNEGCAVKTFKGLKELGGAVVQATADKVNPENNGKPVYVTGEATTSETLSDPAFAVSAPAIKLTRKVEMYQWQENEEKKTERKVGGKEVTTTTYTYKTDWSGKSVDSKAFKGDKAKEEKKNPAEMRYKTVEEVARKVTLGAFTLSRPLIDQINDFTALPFADKELEKLPPDDQKTAAIQDATLYLPNDPKGEKPDPQKPKVGDLRISFQAAKPTTVSIIAQQEGDTFARWTPKVGDPVERLEIGTKGPREMVQMMESEATLRTWLIRLAGFLMLAFGLGLVFSPLAVLADVLPFLGDLLRMGVALFAGLIAAALSLLTIGVAWVAYRPMLGIPLLVLAAALPVALVILAKKKKAAAT